MIDSHDISVNVNGSVFRRRIESRVLLSDFLRNELGLTGTHVGCEHGVCGACTIIMNGYSVRSCLTFAVQADGAIIETVEGLGNIEALDPLQKAFQDHHALQCGFCTPGFLMACSDMLLRLPLSTDAEIREALSGNICRCTGYEYIVNAVREAVQKRGAPGVNLHLLSGGRLRMRRDIYYPGAPREEMVELPVSCTLLKHPQGVVLFDTGCHPSVATDAEARWGSLAKSVIPIFTEQETLIAQLPLAGVATNDVDVVVCSHLHPDHCGCNVFFPKASIIAQATEVAAASADGAPSRGFLSVEWKLPNPIEQIDGERDLFGDGRITLLHMPGHTPGMMIAHVVLDSDGAFVLASDAVSVRAHLDQRFTPRNTWNVDHAMASIEAIARLQQDRATVLFGHDAGQWAGMRTGAEFYA